MADSIVTLAASAARTTDGEGSVVSTRSDDSGARDAHFHLKVTAKSGTTPTLDVDIVHEAGGIDYVLASFTQIGDAVGEERIKVENCPDNVKAKWDLEGTTPSYTFSVIGTRVD